MYWGLWVDKRYEHRFGSEIFREALSTYEMVSRSSQPTGMPRDVMSTRS